MGMFGSPLLGAMRGLGREYCVISGGFCVGLYGEGAREQVFVPLDDEAVNASGP